MGSYDQICSLGWSLVKVGQWRYTLLSLPVVMATDQDVVLLLDLQRLLLGLTQIDS